jgi:hypothetical protein
VSRSVPVSGTSAVFVLLGGLLLAFSIFELLVVLRRESGRLSNTAWPRMLFNWRGVVVGVVGAAVCFVSAAMQST